MSLRKIPRGLELPVPILFLDPAEAIVAIMLVGVGVIAKQPLLGFGGMFGLIYMSRKLSKGAKRGASKHLLWSIGISGIDPAMKRYGPKPTQVDFTE